jgi:hypothetical protein
MKTIHFAHRGAGLSLLCAALALGSTSACVTENVTTGEMVPRGKQKYPFEKVEKAADQLKVGMNKREVLLLLGSPAETSESGDLWVYLPERYAILVPARALRLEFEGESLTDYGYRAIVLGTRL